MTPSNMCSSGAVVLVEQIVENLVCNQLCGEEGDQGGSNITTQF